MRSTTRENEPARPDPGREKRPERATAAGACDEEMVHGAHPAVRRYVAGAQAQQPIAAGEAAALTPRVGVAGCHREARAGDLGDVCDRRIGEPGDHDRVAEQPLDHGRHEGAQGRGEVLGIAFGQDDSGQHAAFLTQGSAFIPRNLHVLFLFYNQVLHQLSREPAMTTRAKQITRDEVRTAPHRSDARSRASTTSVAASPPRPAPASTASAGAGAARPPIPTRATSRTGARISTTAGTC